MDVHLVSNMLQQTWPLSGLDFTDCFFWDLTPFILFCLQPLQFITDKAFITAHLSQWKHIAKKNILAWKVKGQSPFSGPS